MEPNEEYEQIMQTADDNIRRWRNNLKKVDELWAECKRLNLISYNNSQEVKDTTKHNFSHSSSMQIVEELAKEKFYLGRTRRNGIFKRYRLNCK